MDIDMLNLVDLTARRRRHPSRLRSISAEGGGVDLKVCHKEKRSR